MKNKTNKYTWKGAFITAGYVLAAVALFSLTGCVTYLPNISQADRAPLKGRAFYLASVTVSPDATPKGSIDEHCLCRHWP